MIHTRYNGGMIRPKGTKWLAEINRGGQRRKVFDTVPQCQAWLDAEQLTAQRIISTPDQRQLIDADDARRLLPAGISLLDAARVWLEAHKASPLVMATVQELYAKYLVEKTAAGLRPRSLGDLRSYIGRLARDHGSRLISTVTPALLMEYLGTLNAAPVTRNNLRRSWWGFFDWCRRLDAIVSNPAEAITISRQDETTPEIFTPNQAKTILKSAKKLRRDFLPMIGIGLFAGLRTAELMALRWGDISATHIRVTPAVAKKRRQRLIPISDTLRPLIAKSDHPDVRVCPLATRRLYVWLRKIALAAKLPKWPDNAMRHSFASYHLALHQDAAKTAMLLGHSGSAAVLWDHYRELVTEKDARRYFALRI